MRIVLIYALVARMLAIAIHADPQFCQHIQPEGCADTYIRENCIKLCASKDPSFCQHVQREACIETSIKTKCKELCNTHDKECGNFESVSHLVHTSLDVDSVSHRPHTSLGVVDDRIRNAHPEQDTTLSVKDMGGIASLHSSSSDFSSSTQRCAAVLISDRYLVTAAHCFKWQNERLIGIRLGHPNLDEKPFRSSNTYEVQSVHNHPGYKPDTHDYNDISIIKTDRKVQYSQNIWPYCLPEKNQIFNDFMGVRIAGWGHVNQTHASPVIQAAEVELVTNECEDRWMEHAPGNYEVIKKFNYPEGITHQLLCAIKPGIDACRGDSGGPLSYSDIDDRQTVIGIIAKGINCPLMPIMPSFYTNIGHYIDWIYEVTGLGIQKEQINPPQSQIGPIYEASATSTKKPTSYPLQSTPGPAVTPSLASITQKPIDHPINKPLVPIILSNPTSGSVHHPSSNNDGPHPTYRPVSLSSTTISLQQAHSSVLHPSAITISPQTKDVDECSIDYSATTSCNSWLQSGECKNPSVKGNCRFTCSPTGELLRAAWSGNMEGVTTAITTGANPLCQNTIEHDGIFFFNKTAIHMAALANHPGVVKALLDAGVDVNLQTTLGNTPTHDASWNGSIDALNVLINHNANVNLPDSDGSTPLMYASARGHLSVAKALINANASIDVTEGWWSATALYTAAHHGNQDIALLLLESGADTMIPGKGGNTPAARARLRGYNQLAALIDSYTNTHRGDDTTGS